MSETETELLQALMLLEKRYKTYRLDYYKPYEFQIDFHNAIGHLTDNPASQRVLMAANGVGKTFCGAAETAIHLTGRYPEWWKGRKFNRPVEVMVGAKTNDSAKAIVQKELFGDPLDEAQWGSGTIPAECLIASKITRKAGVPNAIQDALVRHASGGLSKVTIMAYEQKAKAFMGTRFDVGWLDEEPPSDIWGQFIRGTISRAQAILYITFTPEEGMTEVVQQFMNDIRPGQAMIRATWDDAPHLTPAEREQRLGALPLHEREMRSRGIPTMGSGLVFPVLDEDIIYDGIKIEEWWPRICGIDFGIDHPFAAVWVAHDRDTDTVYVYDCYKMRGASSADHVAAIKARGEWIPVVWPHDGIQRDKGTGMQLAKQYRDLGGNLMLNHFTNPPAPGQEEGQGGLGVEAGLKNMLDRMQQGRFKVHKRCKEWFDEKQIYHRKDNMLVKVRDDVISASRYATQSLRHSVTKPVLRKRRDVAMGAANW